MRIVYNITTQERFESTLLYTINVALYYIYCSVRPFKSPNSVHNHITLWKTGSFINLTGLTVYTVVNANNKKLTIIFKTLKLYSNKKIVLKALNDFYSLFVLKDDSSLPLSHMILWFTSWYSLGMTYVLFIWTIYRLYYPLVETHGVCYVLHIVYDVVIHMQM